MPTHLLFQGYVCHYLLRHRPQWTLRLQAGRWDRGDRSFFSLAHSWLSSLSSPTDVKELTPEFFLLHSDLPGDCAVEPYRFLVNYQELDLGHRQSGEPVHHVELPESPVIDDSIKVPPTPNNSIDSADWKRAVGFVHRHRSQLDARSSREHLNRWINLVFGCWQRGPPAERQKNIFHWLCYSGQFLELSNHEESSSLRQQLLEFGQQPSQILFHPLPPPIDLWNEQATQYWHRVRDMLRSRFPELTSSSLDASLVRFIADRVSSPTPILSDELLAKVHTRVFKASISSDLPSVSSPVHMPTLDSHWSAFDSTSAFTSELDSLMHQLEQADKGITTIKLDELLLDADELDAFNSLLKPL